jgi:hypothetical protein
MEPKLKFSVCLNPSKEDRHMHIHKIFDVYLTVVDKSFSSVERQRKILS